MTTSDAPSGAIVSVAHLDDPTRCPSCFSGPLEAAAECPSCALPLRSGALAQVWQLSVSAAPLLRSRASLLEQARLEPSAAVPVRASARPPAAVPVPAFTFPPAPYVPPAPRTDRPTFPAPRTEVSRLSVRSILLGLGVLLLGVAATIFLVVAWGSTGVGGRALILGAITAATAAGSAAALRRGLTATAEALATLVVGFLALDAYAVWRLLLVEVPGLTFSAGACAAGAALGAAVAARSSLITPRVTAALLAQAPLPLLAIESSAAGAAALLTAHMVLLSAGELLLRTTRERTARVLVGVGLAAAAAPAGFSAFALAVAGRPVDRGIGSALLAGLAACAAALAYGSRERADLRTSAAAVSTALFLLAALTGVLAAGLPAGRWDTVLAVLSLLAVAALTLLPTDWRPGPGLAAFAAGLLAAATQVPYLATVVLGPVSWLTSPWSSSPTADASAIVAWSTTPSVAPAALFTLGVAAAAALLLAVLLPAARNTARGAGGLLALAVVAGLPMVALPIHVPHIAAIGFELLLAAALLFGGARRSGPSGDALVAAGIVGLGLTALWSLAAEGSTLLALGAAAVLLSATALLSRADEARSPARLLPAGLAATALSAEVFAVLLSTEVGAAVSAAWAAGIAAAVLAVSPMAPARVREGIETGAAVSFAATALLALSDRTAGAPALAAGAVGAAFLAARGDRWFAAPIAAALGCMAAPLAVAAYLPAVHPATGAAAAGLLTLLVGTYALGAHRGRQVVEGVGAAAYGLAVMYAVSAGDVLGAVDTIDIGWLGWALLAGAAVAAAVAVRPERRAAAVPTAALVCAAVPALATAYGLAVSPAPLLGAVTAVLAGLTGTWLWHGRSGDEAMEAVGAVAYTLAVLAGLAAASSTGFTGEALRDLSLLLTVGAVGTAAAAVRQDRRVLGTVTAVLLTGALWARLAGSSVGVVEAYTLPPALLLLAVGFWRARRDAAAGRPVNSWADHRFGLLLALVPTLLLVLTDAGLTRPLLLGAGALGVVLWGASARLQAPLTIGGAVLAIDALVQLAPYAGVVPRWVSFGLAGAVLLAVGTTYERRLRDLRRIKEGYDSLA